MALTHSSTHTTGHDSVPSTPARSIWQRHSDREAANGGQVSGYNQGADVFVRTPPGSGPGSPKQGYALVASVVQAIDKVAGAGK